MSLSSSSTPSSTTMQSAIEFCFDDNDYDDGEDDEMTMMNHSNHKRFRSKTIQDHSNQTSSEEYFGQRKRSKNACSDFEPTIIKTIKTTTATATTKHFDVFSKLRQQHQHQNLSIFNREVSDGSKHCVVEGRFDDDDSGGCGSDEQNVRSHLYASRSLYATSAASVSTDTETLSNGDSGFQDFNSPEDIKMFDKIISDDSTNNNINSYSDDSSLIMERSNELVSIAETEEIDFNHQDDDDNVSFDSDLSSSASDLSNISGEGWKPIHSKIGWIQNQIRNGVDPRELIQHLTGEMVSDIGDIYAWRLLMSILTEPSRPKLTSINTIDDVIDLIQKSSKIIVLTGAGVSVSCGIPDFRSRNGIYAQLSKEYPDLPDPQSMFDIRYFRTNPYPFFKFAKQIYPGQFQPSSSHRFIKFLETKGKLLRNYSQNIDTLEKAAGIKNLITCHGSFATATCTVCCYKVDSSAIKNDIFQQKIPLCPNCTSSLNDDETDSKLFNMLPVIKPDIVFFGEGLSDEFHNSMTLDKDQCDLLIVIGSSLKVRPVGLIPNSIPETVPQILINREPLKHFNFDVELLGDCDVVVKHLCKRLGKDWLEACFLEEDHQDQIAQSLNAGNDFEYIAPCRHVFKGAELGDQESEADEEDDEDDDDDDDCEEDSEDDNEKIDETNKSETCIANDLDQNQIKTEDRPNQIDNCVGDQTDAIIADNMNDSE